MAIQTKIYNDGGSKYTLLETKGKEANTQNKKTPNGGTAFGSNVTNAVNQAVQGITDGIKNVVKEASSSGGSGGGGTDSTPAATPNYDTTVPQISSDPELLAQYQNAMSALEAMKGQTPTYGNRYDEQIQNLYQQIMNRGQFKYDPETDPLYKQYEQSYIQRGKMASRDVMGQAAGLTGGYGSSYGQAVGQQAYDQYLTKLADVLPETYGMALDAWNAENNRLNQNLSTTVGLEQSDYAKYLDQLNQYNNELDRAYQQENLWYGRMTDDEQKNYNRQGDAYSMLVNLMAMGYRPSKEDYARAGLSEAQGEALRGAYLPQAQTVYIKGNSKGNDNNTGTTDLDRLLAEYLGGSSTSSDLKKSSNSNKKK